jgi:hypothetical protein
LEDPRIAELEDVAARAVAAVAGEEPVGAAVAMFLLRHYLATGAPELGEVLGTALAQALAHAGRETSVIGRAEWLTLLVEATALADDERIVPAAAQLVAALRATGPAGTRVDEGSASVEACLRAAALLDPGELIQEAIDHLERVVGGSYRPGDGLILTHAGVRRRGSLDDHVRGSSALLTAFELTGRLPYSMLAEELMAIAGREPSPDADLVISCEAARVLCRLAALHDDPEYRGAAVIASGADYRAAASRLLAAQSARARAATTSAAAAYGLALRDLLGHVR